MTRDRKPRLDPGLLALVLLALLLILAACHGPVASGTSFHRTP